MKPDLTPAVIYEDDDIVAVNKPAGLVVHADGKTDESALTDWVVERYPETINVGEPARTAAGQIVPRPGIVHRLDRQTSGVILVAKTEAAFAWLKSQFQSREVEKEYRAFVCGSMKADRGTIDRPIGRSARDFRMWSAQRGARGELREAVTDYEVILRTRQYTFVKAFPRTGRTHQIRVHFKAINYPIVGDFLYAPGRENDLGFGRVALHSYRVAFTDLLGERREVVAPYPEDFERALSYMTGLLQS